MKTFRTIPRGIIEPSTCRMCYRVNPKKKLKRSLMRVCSPFPSSLLSLPLSIYIFILFVSVLNPSYHPVPPFLFLSLSLSHSPSLPRCTHIPSHHETEFEFVKQAFYTEPDDQSAWLYHRWLGRFVVVVTPVLGRFSSSLFLGYQSTNTQLSQFIFSFSLSLSHPPPLSLLPKHTPVASSAVHTTPKTEGKGLPTFGAFQGFQAAAPTSEKNDSDGSDKTGPTDLSRHLLVLHREVEMCEELLQLEPNCKWALLTVAFLLNGITLHGESVNGYAEKVGDTFSRLTSLDPLRTTYYRDMQTALLSSS